MRLTDADSIHDTLDIYKSNVQYCLGDENEIIKTIEVFECFIDRQPTIDAVEVVRCKDCKHKPYRDEDGFIEPESGRCPCINDDDDYYSWIPEDDWFCGWGERKEE